MQFRQIILLFCLFVFCSQDAQVDRNLFGTWLVIGYENRVSGRIVDGYGNTVDEALELYRIYENSITKFTRGYSTFLGEKQFYDTLHEKLYTASFTENAITMDDSIECAYGLRSQCSSNFLKLTKWQLGFDLITQTKVTIEINEYCIRVNNDSLPSSWPGEADVMMPNQNCDPGDLINW